MKKMLPVRFEDSEIEEIRAQAAAEGRSLQDYVHDVLMLAVAARTQRRRATASIGSPATMISWARWTWLRVRPRPAVRVVTALVNR